MQIFATILEYSFISSQNRPAQEKLRSNFTSHVQKNLKDILENRLF